MKQSKLLYRYRKSESFNIDAFCNNEIIGSLYSAFLDQGELNFVINYARLLKLGIPKYAADDFLKTIKDSYANNYYMACLSKTAPSEDSYVRKKFAGQDGFCVVYTYESINNQILYEHSKEKRIEIKSVQYNNNPYDVCPIVEPIAKIVINNEGASDEEKDALLEDYIKNGADKKLLGNYVVSGFIHKKEEYRKEREVRLFMQKNGKLHSGIDHPVIMNVIPAKVFLSKKMNVFYQHKIIEHAEELGIPWGYFFD